MPLAPGAHLPGLTALRVPAAVAVLAFHVVVATSTGTGAWREVVSAAALSAVSLFFVLSGLVLTWGAGDLPVRRFLRRRAARLLPLHVLAWVLALVALAAGPGGAASVGEALLALSLLQSFVPDVPTVLAVNPVLWSLSAELAFSVVLPFVLPWLRRLPRPVRRRLLGVLLAVPVLVAAVVSLLPDAHAETGRWLVAYAPPVRAAEFGIGVLLALELRDGLPRVPLPAGLAVAVAGVLVAALAPVTWRWAAVTVVPFAVLVVAVAQHDLAQEGGVRDGAGVRALDLLGAWTFAFYLTHVPVGLLLDGQRLPWLLAVVPVAAAAHHLVERPLYARLR